KEDRAPIEPEAGVPSAVHRIETTEEHMSVIIGIDPHKASHTAVAIDDKEVELSAVRVRSTRRQVDQLLEWAEPMEGWHGVAFDRPVRRTRETIEIIRAITAGERLDHDGEIYELPLPGSEGRAIRSLMPPAHLPIYVASLGPANLRLTGELADGWLGTSFFPETADVFLDPIREGADQAARDIADLDLTVAVGLEFTDDVEAAGRRHADGYAFTIGAMGSAGTNFCNNAFERQGYGDDVRDVQRHWLAGDKDAARRRVPAAIGLGTNLIGTDDLVRDRLPLPRRRHHHLARHLYGGAEADLDHQLGDVERLLDLVGQVNDEMAEAKIG
ncbi:MAG: hypothetical protein QOC66_975, partial [Pseudonocardiales bacterium]|nr:hypothetical protein [Pseudonocardiales bacterium]